MLNGKSIAVVVPAYNEERQIVYVVETMPDFVDYIVVVDDFSTDKTSEVVKELMARSSRNSAAPLRKSNQTAVSTRYNYADIMADKLREQEEEFYIPLEEFQIDHAQGIILLRHKRNGGVGAAIASGYKWCRDHGVDCTAVMAGDGQMDPAELRSICEPVVNEEVDYTKGNRLIHKAAGVVIPKIRFLGNSVLSILTKIASGYWHVSDTQSGYTAISSAALEGIELYKIYPRYGMPNDMLVRLNIGSFSIKEIPIKPVYNIGEISKMKIPRVIPPIFVLLVRGFFRRLFLKYLFMDFHPLFICYLMFFLTGLLDLYIIVYMTHDYFFLDKVNKNYLMIGVLNSLLCVQFLLFGMWFDMQDNERLQK